MKAVTIQVAANGYIAAVASQEVRQGFMPATEKPHVFESFETLVQWLDREIGMEKPPAE